MKETSWLMEAPDRRMLRGMYLDANGARITEFTSGVFLYELPFFEQRQYADSASLHGVRNFLPRFRED